MSGDNERDYDPFNWDDGPGRDIDEDEDEYWDHEDLDD